MKKQQRREGEFSHFPGYYCCNCTSGMSIANEVDSYLYIGSGNFHSLGLALAIDKPVVAAENRAATNQIG